MNLINILRLKSKLVYLLLVILGLLSSLTNMTILLMINITLSGENFTFLPGYRPLLFLLMMVVSFTATRFFQNRVVKISNDLLFDLELAMVQKVQSTSFESFEKLGAEKIYAAINDTRVLSRIPEIFVSLINSFVTILCALGYLYWISPVAATIILVVMANLLLIYFARNEKMERDLNQVRDLQNSYFRYLQELLLGFKQLRISALRSSNLFNNHILLNRNKARDLSVSASRQYVVNQLIGVYSWYILFGIILFLLPLIIQINLGEIAAFITSVLFMMTPISQLISFFPFYTGCKIALERINGIYTELEINAVQVVTNTQVPGRFDTIRFENVSYQYASGDKNIFALDSLNLTVYKGEILFIVGGNGSGKSTFINVLTGLCRPTSGRIFIDEKEMSWQDYASFNNHMAVVYSNQYLFRENYDNHDLSESARNFIDYRNLFNLLHVLRMDDAGTNLSTNLSKGEQKRVSLMLGLLEDKPLIVLDEWAAEQDPRNRRMFYTQWLRHMTEMGKTVIAVSHDDDFYHEADRVIKFNYGKIVHDTVVVE